jgi:hypothetical protein
VPGHFDSIGFPADDEGALKPFIRRAMAEGDQFEVIGAEPGWGGRYICWNAGGGPQLWLAVDERGALTGVDPHFAGRGRAHISLERSFDYDGSRPPAGGIFAWINPGADEETKAGFDLPAFARFYDMACDYDGNALVQVAAFCHGGEVFADEADYAAAQREAHPELSFEIESFIPIGMFDVDGAIPPATARLSGRVLEADRLTNPATGRHFWAVLVKTFGMTVDVVADDEQLTGRPEPGSVLAGSFWLSAVPADGPKRAGTTAINDLAGVSDPRITIDRVSGG